MAEEEIKRSEEVEEFDDPGEFDIQDDEEIEGVSFSDDIHDVTGVDFKEIDELSVHTGRPDSESDWHGAAQTDAPKRESRSKEELEEEKIYGHVPALTMIAHALLFTIPVVGVVFMTIYIADGNRNIHLRKLAGIWMILLLLIMTALCVAVVLLGQAGTIPGLPNS